MRFGGQHDTSAPSSDAVAKYTTAWLQFNIIFGTILDFAVVNASCLESHSVYYHVLLQVQLLGQPISVGRPSGYVDPTAAQQSAAAAAAALEQFKVSAGVAGMSFVPLLTTVCFM